MCVRDCGARYGPPIGPKIMNTALAPLGLAIEELKAASMMSKIEKAERVIDMMFELLQQQAWRIEQLERRGDGKN